MLKFLPIPVLGIILSCCGIGHQIQPLKHTPRPEVMVVSSHTPWKQVAAAYAIQLPPAAGFYKYLERMRKKYKHGHGRAIDYIHNNATLAHEAQQAFGIPAELVLAVGMLESGFGQSSMATRGQNHFGMKKGSHVGATFVCENKIQWRAYDNVSQSYFDFALAVSSNYPQVLNNPTPKVFAATGWAGDDHSAYARQLERLIQRYELKDLFTNKIFSYEL